MYKCKCGKEYQNSQAYVGHCGHCEIHLGYKPKDRIGKGRGWAKGLRKGDHPGFDRFLTVSKNPENLLTYVKSKEGRKRSSDNMKKNQRNPDFVVARTLPRLNAKEGFIYIIDYEDCLKVGFTANIKQRHKKHGYRSFYKITQLNCEQALRLECNLHKKFNKNSLVDKGLEFYPKELLPKLIEYIDDNC